ncbi:hypothetical protein BGX31_004310 [Mortierella sp. GBA43]|nr:hypothetical protein BGX31_004310 [Mortierella sp. GBA43]
MNTAAPTPSYHTHSHSQDASYAKSDPYAAERISAQEAMKGMRISESHQLNRRKSNDIDDACNGSRVDRHLANRAQSVRESSRPYAEKEASLKVAERRRSSPENASVKVHDPDTPTLSSIPESDNGANSDGKSSGQPIRQTQSYAQGPNVPQDHGSHSAPTNQFHNQKAPIPPSPSTENGSAPAPPPPQPSSSGRQSRLNSVGSSKESYRRKYGDIQGYTYIGTIGQGNFGKVLLAENDLTGEKVAVKILEKAQFKSEQQRLHATREARLMATLRHPNIVDVKTVMEDDQRILIVMENLTGGELFDYISNKGSLDEREARRIFHQIVLAIHYCHEMVSGTPYVGPETDVWSLGVILYVLVCGRLPFDASDLPALFAQIKRGNYQKPREGSIDVCSLIHRMLTVDPKRRATLTDVLKSRWMRADGMDPMVTAPPVLSTAPIVMQPTQPQSQSPQPQSRTPQPVKPNVLPTHHLNQDIGTMSPTSATSAPTHDRHSYHAPSSPAPGTLEASQQETTASHSQYQHQHPRLQLQLQTAQPVRELRHSGDSDEQMSDVSPSMSNSPTETMATISPSTPIAPTSKEDALSAAVGVSPTLASYQKRSGGGVTNGNQYEDNTNSKHHPYKHHLRTNSVQTQGPCHVQGQSQTPENVTIVMCPSSDAIAVDGIDTTLKKKRKALTKLRQFFRLETSKC